MIVMKPRKMQPKEEEEEMPNNLFNLLNGAPQQNGMQQQFDNFRKTVNGNPQQIVENLVNSGKMTQQQYQQLSQMANILRNTIK